MMDVSSIFLSFTPAACTQSQPLDAPLLHLFPADRQLLCAEHVCGSGGGELPQVSSGPGGRGGAPAWGEEAETAGEKAQE